MPDGSQDIAGSPPPCSREQRELLAAIDRQADDALALARWMSAHPELSLQERETSARYVAYLSSRGFEVEAPVAGLETAFVARRGSASGAIAVALLAEMDALPEIGHACGHNLSGPASLLAASALASVLPEETARIVVVGTPAEEIGVGKRRLVEAGIFDEVDCAIMAHASDMRRAHRLFLGNAKFEFVYRGRAAHAAAYPEEGINALDAVISLFVSLGLLRQQLPPSARVSGIVTDGGRAPNVIPERAAARVWVRALEEDVLDASVEKVLRCARAAADATGTQLEIAPEEGVSPTLRVNSFLTDVYRRQLDRMGLPETGDGAGESIGSSDVTHVSRVVPTIHPNFPVGTDLMLHTREFAEATTRPEGEAGMLEAARALALTAAELVRCPGSRDALAAGWAGLRRGPRAGSGE